MCDVCAFKPTVFGETKLCEVLRHGQNGFVLIVFVEHVWKIAEVITVIVLQNIISHADIFPFSKSHVEPSVNHGTKNIWLCRCFVNFSGGEVVCLSTFCGIAVFRAPQCPLAIQYAPKLGHWSTIRSHILRAHLSLCSKMSQ